MSDDNQKAQDQAKVLAELREINKLISEMHSDLAKIKSTNE